MTKKAEKLLKSFNEKANNHVDFYFNHPNLECCNKQWFIKYLEDMHKEFDNMVLGMFRFGFLSLNDMEELMNKSLEIYQPLEKRLYK